MMVIGQMMHFSIWASGGQATRVETTLQPHVSRTEPSNACGHVPHELPRNEFTGTLTSQISQRILRQD